MSSEVPVIEAEHILACQNNLGEGVLWDNKTNLLHWVDLNEAEIHTYDPETKGYSVDSYKGQSEFLTAIACRRDQPGFIGLLRHHIAFLPAATKPTSTEVKPKPNQRTAEILVAPLPKDPVKGKPTRFNDAGCDPQGSYVVGSMTIPEVGDGQKRGQVWKYDPDGSLTQIFDAVGTSNGIGWSPDGSTMSSHRFVKAIFWLQTIPDFPDYVDSADHEVLSYTYSSGKVSNRQVLATTPPLMPPAKEALGVFDGLCLDGVGNVWVARWGEERIVGYSPKGEIICNIKVPKCKNATIPCFGGKNLDTMFIVSAHSRHGGNGDIHDQYPWSGDLFQVDFSEGSEVRKLLGENWEGGDRYRFAG